MIAYLVTLRKCVYLSLSIYTLVPKRTVVIESFNEKHMARVYITSSYAHRIFVKLNWYERKSFKITEYIIRDEVRSMDCKTNCHTNNKQIKKHEVYSFLYKKKWILLVLKNMYFYHSPNNFKLNLRFSEKHIFQERIRLIQLTTPS